jgi:hypothetical protein
MRRVSIFLFSSFSPQLIQQSSFDALLIIIISPTHKINNKHNSKQITNIQNQIFAMSQQVVDIWWQKNLKITIQNQFSKVHGGGEG